MQYKGLASPLRCGAGIAFSHLKLPNDRACFHFTKSYERGIASYERERFCLFVEAICLIILYFVNNCEVQLSKLLTVSVSLLATSVQCSIQYSTWTKSSLLKR